MKPLNPQRVREVKAPYEWTPPELTHHHRGACECIPMIAYIRVSRVGDRQELISPKIQLDSIYALCQRKGYRLVAIFSDINKSGRTFRKRSVDKCLALVKEGRAQGVAVWKWSRWGRNQVDSEQYVRRMYAIRGRVESATEDIPMTGALGRYTVKMIMANDELMSDTTSEGWKAAQAIRRQNGLPHSGRGRIGYDYVNKLHVINDVEAEHVRWMYEQYVHFGLGFGELAHQLNQKGLLNSLGNPWSAGGLGKYMDTGFAAGWLRSQSEELRYKIEQGEPGVSKETFDEWWRGKHEPIISAELWDAYRGKRSSTRQGYRASAAIHELSRLLVCGVCARIMSAVYSGKHNAHRWRCSVQGDLHRDLPCSVSNIQIITAITDWLATAGTPEWYALARARVAADTKRAGKIDVKSLKDRLAAIKRKQKNLLTVFLGGDATEDEMAMYKAERGRLNAEALEIETQLGEAGPRAADVVSPTALRAMADAWGHMNTKQCNAMLHRVVGMIVVTPVAQAAGRERRWEVVPVWEMSSWVSWLGERRNSPLPSSSAT